MLKKNKKEEVYLGNKKIKEKEIQEIIEHLKEDKIIKSIDLSGNEITKIPNLKEIKNNETLLEIQLYNNKISEEGSKDIQELLEGNKNLQSLHVYSNNIMDKGCNLIGNSLKNNTTLKYLFLSGIYIMNKTKTTKYLIKV
jgi:Ran GTPase-activating protein (RanGAP) involved in mRNA processing and transport